MGVQILGQVKQWERGRPESEVIQFVEELFAQYLSAVDKERQLLRRAVRENRSLWNVVGDDDISLYLAHLVNQPDDGGVRRLRGWLLVVSLTGGCGDWRDTIVVLDKLRKEVESHGVATRGHFEQIAATADAGNKPDYIYGMSTRDLILSAGGLCWFEGEVVEKADLLRRAIMEGVSVGDIGKASTPLRPAGRVIIRGIMHSVRAESGFIEEGCMIVVVRSDQFGLIVKAAEEVSRANLQDSGAAVLSQEQLIQLREKKEEQVRRDDARAERAKSRVETIGCGMVLGIPAALLGYWIAGPNGAAVGGLGVFGLIVLIRFAADLFS